LLLTAKFNNMKYLPFLCLKILFFASVLSVCAQVPQLINYQAVLRDAAWQPLPNQAVLVRLTIHQSSATGTIQYQEIHSITSNAQASINLQIGGGASITGNFSNISWADGQPKFLEIELDPDDAGPQSYINLGTQQLVSVPYSVYSDNTKLVKTNNDNLSVGQSNYNLTGFTNTGVGVGALLNNTTGYYNTANGSSALYSNTTGYANSAFGSVALNYNTTGNWNTATGSSALYYNTTGDNNTANGSGALEHNTIGISNVANGTNALYTNTTGSYNTANGKEALYSNSTGDANTANGDQALYSNTTGEDNTANGYTAMAFNTTGGANTANGSFALYNNSSGNQNTAYGYSALNVNTTGSWNTCIGDRANVNSSNLNGASSLGTQAITNADNKIVLGANIGGMTIGGYANWSNLSDGRFKQNVKSDVPGLSFIEQLRPVTYTVDIDKLQHHITAQMPDSIAQEYYPTPEQISAANAEIRTGFIAQEVEAAAQKIGYSFDGINPPQNPTDNYSLEYAGFVPSLVKAVQEQQAVIEEQSQTINALKLELQLIKEKLGLK